MINLKVYIKSENRIADVDCIDFIDKTVRIVNKNDCDNDIVQYLKFDEVKLLLGSGVVDKTVKEIFEGDILSPETNFHHCRVVVKREEENGIRLNAYNETDDDFAFMIDSEYSNRVEIIGHISDKKES